MIIILLMERSFREDDRFEKGILKMSTHAMIKHERMGYGDIKIYAGTASEELSKKVADYLKVPLCEQDVITFPNENLLIKLKKRRTRSGLLYYSNDIGSGASKFNGITDHGPDFTT